MRRGKMPTGHKGKKRPAEGAAKEQSDRFKNRQLGCDETPGALDRAFGKIEPKRAQEKIRSQN
jgi:hypothetical protein